MRRTDDRLRYSPSDLAYFMESRYSSWMTRYDLEHPGEKRRDAADDVLEVLRRHGLEHERRVLDALRAEGLHVVEIPDDRARFENTRRALAEGPDVIYQAALAGGAFDGSCDFLLRRDRPSRLGPHGYEPLEAKSARRVKPAAAIQLACYAAMLEAIQGAEVERLHLALGDGQRVRLRHADVRYFFDVLRREFLEFHRAFDDTDPPEPEPNARLSPWQGEAERHVLERDGLSRVADISRAQVRKLLGAGVTTRAELAAREDEVPGLSTATLGRLADQARLQVASDGKGRPDYAWLATRSAGNGPGLAELPDASALDVYFDLEGYPLGAANLEYLWGASHADGFRDEWAFDEESEREALESFLRWILERRERDPSMHVYHYGAYEVSAIKRLASRHATLEHELDGLLREERFIDLYRVVRNSLRIGAPSYSLKDVERLYRDGREAEVARAVDSIVEYDRWLQSGQPADWRASEILAEIRRYNREDCESTAELAAWLRDRRAEAIAAPAPALPERPETEQRRRRREHVETLRHRLHLTGEGEAPFAGLLAQLLEFHQREDRPGWWTFFDQRAMSEEQLFEDYNCLAGLRYRRPARDAENTRSFRYDFDPSQHSKISAGTDCFMDGDLEMPVEVTAIEPERGATRIVFPFRTWNRLQRNAPARFSLIPRDTFRTDTISGAILRLAERYAEHGELPGALLHFLERRPPVIEGHAGGSLVREGENATDAVPRLCATMQETSLVIQGPPGSGKTTTAARAILRLLERGVTIGVASNSHKAILNLQAKCAELGPDDLRPLKAGGDAGDLFFRRFPAIRRVSNAEVGAMLERHPLVGGTVWLFSREEMAGRLDYLFIDEAGQVPLANLVAMSRSARNLVLIGDPVQLPQPTQAAHPGDSGQSTLEYALDGAATIDPALGVFLDRSFRLHPDLCRTISEAFYDGRLFSAEGRENRVLRLEPPLAERLRRAGMSFVPVAHDDNTQSSPEEVAEIAGLVEQLARCEVTDLKGCPAGRLGHEGILVVAPYNLQVRALERALPSGVRVGTVDKFQGQEAPVVLVSMSASDATRSPRGLSFLLDPNRLNVAISRARCLAVVVGNPGLVHARAETIEQLERINLFCRILEEGSAAG